MGRKRGRSPSVSDDDACAAASTSSSEEEEQPSSRDDLSASGSSDSDSDSELKKNKKKKKDKHRVKRKSKESKKKSKKKKNKKEKDKKVKKRRGSDSSTGVPMAVSLLLLSLLIRPSTPRRTSHHLSAYCILSFLPDRILVLFSKPVWLYLSVSTCVFSLMSVALAITFPLMRFLSVGANGLKRSFIQALSRVSIDVSLSLVFLHGALSSYRAVCFLLSSCTPPRPY